MSADLSVMPAELVSEGTTRYVVSADETWNFATHLLTRVAYRFPNDFGASVFSSEVSCEDKHSNGNFELAVLAWAGEGEEADGWLTTETPISDASQNDDGVITHLRAAEVEALLLRIKRLPA